MDKSINRDISTPSQFNDLGIDQSRSRTAYSNQLMSQERWAESLMQEEERNRSSPASDDNTVDNFTTQPVFQKQENGRIVRMTTKQQRNVQNKLRPFEGYE